MTRTNNSTRTRAIVTPSAPGKGRQPASAAAAGLPRPDTGTKARARVAATPVATAPGADIASATKPKAKLVRDSFTIPKSEYSVLEALKLRAAGLTRPVTKSELLRAGIAALNSMGDKAFLSALNGVPSLKTGRPKASDAAAASGKGNK
jgi:hypothetical protein